MQITNTEEARLFLEVTVLEQSLVQKQNATVEESYLADIYNRTNNFISNTVAEKLTCLQNNYLQLMPHELLEREDIVKKTTYNPRYPIMTAFSSVK